MSKIGRSFGSIVVLNQATYSPKLQAVSFTAGVF